MKKLTRNKLCIRTLFGFLFLSTVFIAFAHADSLDCTVNAAARFPSLAFKLGAFDIYDDANAPGVSAAAQAAAYGYSFTGATYNPSSDASYSSFYSNNVSLLDQTPLILIYNQCQANGQFDSQNCTLSQAQVDSIASMLKQQLSDPREANNSFIAGFYAQDDYVGTVTNALSAIHNVVQASNKAPGTPFPRPVICPYGFKVPPLQSTDIMPEPNSPTNWTNSLYGFSVALRNYSPKWCDVVGLYAYGSSEVSNDSNQFDWSMGNSLPQIKQALMQAGWDPCTQPLLVIPQTFSYPWGVVDPWGNREYYVTPTRSQVAMQVKAFCDAGATSLLGWYEDSYARRGNGTLELYNSEDMRGGFADGFNYCRQVWNARSSRTAGTTTPSSSTTTSTLVPSAPVVTFPSSTSTTLLPAAQSAYQTIRQATDALSASNVSETALLQYRQVLTTANAYANKGEYAAAQVTASSVLTALKAQASSNTVTVISLPAPTPTPLPEISSAPPEPSAPTTTLPTSVEARTKVNFDFLATLLFIFLLVVASIYLAAKI